MSNRVIGKVFHERVAIYNRNANAEVEYYWRVLISLYRWSGIRLHTMKSAIRCLYGLLLLGLPGGIAWAQNLIPNPRFRNLTDCRLTAQGTSHIEYAPPWYGIGKFYPVDGLYAKCVWARADTNIIALTSNYATIGGTLSDLAGYAVAPLIQPLRAGQLYWIGMLSLQGLGFINVQRSQAQASYGANFTVEPPTTPPNNQMIPVGSGVPSVLFPQLPITRPSSVGDLYAWQRMGSCFAAKGGEQYITIGDYRVPAYTNRFASLYITDLSLLAMPDRISLGPDTAFCAGQRLTLNAHFPFPATYRWQNGTTDSTLTVTQTGLYALTITCPCRTYTDTVRVTVRNPDLQLGADTSVCDGHPIVLDAGPGYDRYRWQDNSTASTLTVSKPGLYVLDVERFNCTARDSVRVQPSGDCCTVYLPTVFSPNADGQNDVFSVVTGCSDIIYEPDLLIYNRWGTVIFRTQDVATGWNGLVQGTPAPAGSYTWLFWYGLPQRQSVIRRQERGTVLLIR